MPKNKKKELSETLSFIASIENGKLVLNSPEYFKNRISMQPDTKRVHVKIEPPLNKRSLGQNNLYWLYMTDIVKETGNDDRYALHEHFKQKFLFLGEKQVKFTDEKGKVHVHIVKKYGSSAALSKGEFMDFLLSVEAETGVPIPDTEIWMLQGLDINSYYSAANQK